MSSPKLRLVKPDPTPQEIVRSLNDSEKTEVKMGKLFASWAKSQAIYMQEKKQWYLWNGNVWQADQANHMTALTSTFLSSLSASCENSPYSELSETIKKFETLGKLNNMAKLATPALAHSISDLDQDPMLLAVANTYIDLETGQPIPPDPAHLVSISSPVQYDPEADCPVFKEFINTIFQGDEDIVSFLQKMVGYSVTGRGDEQCLFILNGDGANGKSTLMNIIGKLLGGYARTAASHTLMANTRSGVGDDLMHLVGSRFINVSETDQGQALAEAKIKRITGGDSITARALYGTYGTFTLDGKIWLATNNLPRIQGRDHGIFRRLRVIPFNKQFAPDQQDKTLPDRLELELSGIMNWAIEGCLKWQADGLNPPQIIQDQLDQYQTDMDTVGNYVVENLVLLPEGKLQSSVLYGHYKDWCRCMGYAFVDQRDFKSSLERIDGVSYGRSKNVRSFKGIGYQDKAA
ncbi:phage/plasmid primase, P4 family [Rhodobacteraceae bacterium]|nr:phage/plasmid primase, P4 family [Paracoccaceae bacterium]